MAADEKKRRWRSTYQKQIELVASIEEQIGKLDWEIPGLWRDFYAWDDPAYRDGVIKPKLDEALVRRQRLEDQLTVDVEDLHFALGPSLGDDRYAVAVIALAHR